MMFKRKKPLQLNKNPVRRRSTAAAVVTVSSESDSESDDSDIDACMNANPLASGVRVSAESQGSTLTQIGYLQLQKEVNILRTKKAVSQKSNTRQKSEKRLYIAAMHIPTETIDSIRLLLQSQPTEDQFLQLQSILSIGLFSAPFVDAIHPLFANGEQVFSIYLQQCLLLTRMRFIILIYNINAALTAMIVS